MKAVQVRKMLKTQLVIQVERRSSSSVNTGKNCEDWLQNNLLMIFARSRYFRQILNGLRYFSGQTSHKPY